MKTEILTPKQEEDYTLKTLKAARSEQIKCYEHITTNMQNKERTAALKIVEKKIKSLESAISFLSFLKLNYI